MVKFIKEIDKILLFFCLTASTISCLMMHSFYVNNILTLKTVVIQTIAVVLGLIAAIIISRIDYVFIARIWKIHLSLTLFLVILTFFIGIKPSEYADDRAWLSLGITTFQPSELLKLSFICTFALHLSKVKERLNNIKEFLLLCLHAAIPIALIMLQGDFGTALVFLGIFLFMIFAAGLSLTWLLGGFIVGVTAAPIIWQKVLPDHLKSRFLVALQPEIDHLGVGNQQYYGRMAFGSGQLFGSGIYSERLVYVSEQYNDFIFSYIGQTMGFVGAVITLLIILGICVKILINAIKSKDELGSLICVGVFAVFVVQSVINIGMVLCVLPVIGITLPLFSQGGTSILMTYMSIGLVMSVYRANQESEYMFD